MKTPVAPIVLFVYARPEHTKQTIEALALNRGADKSILIIFSDGPKSEDLAENVKKVRQYLHSIIEKKIFRQVYIYESQRNKGLANSIIDGVTRVFSEYDSVIVLEDDLVTAPDFIEYMNDALIYYKDNPLIWSISGYTPPIKLPKGYNHDIYLSYRACSCGWGTWKDRWEKVDWEVKDYSRFRRNLFERMAFNKGGSDMSKMLDYQMEGKIDSWAIRWCYSQFKHNMLTVYPVVSRIKNIGLDGSGTHKVTSTKWDVEISYQNSPCKFENVAINPKIIKEFRKKYNVEKGEYIKAALHKLWRILVS
ncbi:MAG: sugar transferase [Candidatus Margulisiibacteriota bacterium]